METYGFRAASLALFKNEDAWIQTKKMMLHNLEKNTEVYKTYGVLNISELQAKLATLETPARNEYCFDTLECPQVLANTFNRVVILFATTPQIRNCKVEQDDEGRNVYNKDMQTFVPCFGLDLNFLDDPIVLFLYNSHFYLLEIKVDKASNKQMKFPAWPAVNPYHSFVIKKHSDVCQCDFSGYFK